MAPITQFEIAESVRFFGSIVATPGITPEVLDKCNEYILRLINSLEGSVTNACASASGLKIIK